MDEALEITVENIGTLPDMKPVTISEMLQSLESYSFVLLALFLLLPVLAWFLGKLLDASKAQVSPWKYVYSAIVYTVCVPGIGAGTLLGYNLFFLHKNLLEVNVFTHFVPLVSMAVTLILVAKTVEFEKIPGLERLSGLMIVIAVVFVLMLIVEKTRIWLLFGGSFSMFIAAIVGLIALLQWGSYSLFRKKNEPRKKLPRVFKS